MTAGTIAVDVVNSGEERCQTQAKKLHACVTYDLTALTPACDLTALTPAGENSLESFEKHYDGMIESWSTEIVAVLR